MDKKRIKLLYLTNGIDGPGGLERVLSIKASFMAENMEYDVHIASMFGEVDSLFYEFSSKVCLHFLDINRNPIKYFFSYRAKIKSLIKSIEPDILLVCDDGLKGLLLPKIIKTTIPLVYERHVSKNAEIKSDNLSLYRKIISKIKFSLMDYGAKKYDAFVVLTDGNRKEWDLKNLHIIPNPLSFYPTESELSNLRSKKVIAVGKQSFQKGYDRLLQAWKIVSKHSRGWILEIYGSLDPSGSLEKLSEDLHIRDSVRFYKPVKDIGSKYQDASIYVMSSRYEGFGMVLTEAMAYGVPCISFDCPSGPSDIIESGRNGFLVPNGDIEAFSNSILNLVEDLSLRLEFGKAARMDMEKYLPEKICQKWNLLFLELLNKR